MNLTSHSVRLHRQALMRERQQHKWAMEQERKLHESALRVDHRLHFEGILADLREQDREADRDLWEQRTERFQLLLTVASLLTAGGFTLAVEGQLPPGATNVAPFHYFLLALGFGLQLCVIMGCLALTNRFAEFMDLRVHKQQLLNKDLRRTAVRMLDSGRPRSREEDEATICRFERMLRQQYVIETCASGHHSRHIWNFKDWYEQRCSKLALFVELSFRFGMIGLLGSVLTFIYAQLEEGDGHLSVKSSTAWQSFGITLGGLILVGVCTPQLVGSSWMWRLQRDSLRPGQRHFYGLFSPHKPVRFDMQHVSEQAEELFHSIDTDGNGTLSLSELEEAAVKARERVEHARAEAVSSPVLCANADDAPCGFELPASLASEPSRSALDASVRRRLARRILRRAASNDHCAVIGRCRTTDSIQPAAPRAREPSLKVPALPPPPRGSSGKARPNVRVASQESERAEEAEAEAGGGGGGGAAAPPVARAPSGDPQNGGRSLQLPSLSWCEREVRRVEVHEDTDPCSTLKSTDGMPEVQARLRDIILPGQAPSAASNFADKRQGDSSRSVPRGPVLPVFQLNATDGIFLSGSPRDTSDEERRILREEKAAATAVLETIIRQMAHKCKRTNRRHPIGPINLSQTAERSRHSTIEWQVTKRMWDDAIAEALF
ncbi:hypothetical protein AB1Y20_004692 [Prymnesium parvum]